MKKLFALILAVVMICAMSVSVFAADTTEHIIGNGTGNTTDNDSYTDGLAENLAFPNAGTYNVNVTATVGQVEHRYAVDITYPNMTFDVAASNLVWNVNTLKYDVKEGNGTTIGTDKAYEIKVTNYSDLPVDLTVAVADDVADGATVAAHTNANDNVAFTEARIESAIGASGASVGQAKTQIFFITVKAGDWNAVANYYAAYFTANPNSNGTAIMGTASITISKVSN